MVSSGDLAQQLRTLGVIEGSVLLVHASLRAVGQVENGADGVVDALREAVGEDGTLVMPSWGADGNVLFRAHSTPAAPDLGVVADRFWRREGVLRSTHPFAFAAWGPKASRILIDPMPLPPHGVQSPVGRVWEADGQVLLLGVGQDTNTTIHLTEVLHAVPYRLRHKTTVLEKGAAKTFSYWENDCCCEKFELADRWLRDAGAMAEGAVGNAQARLMRASDIVDVVGEALSQDELVFLHDVSEGCAECNLARDNMKAQI